MTIVTKSVLDMTSRIAAQCLAARTRRGVPAIAACALALNAHSAHAQITSHYLTAPPNGLQPHYLYNGVNRPLMVDVIAPRMPGALAIMLLDHEGTVLADVAPIEQRRQDLAELFPSLWEFRQCVYVQLLFRDEPTGPALILQPMLSRQVPMVEQDTHAVYGNQYTRIVGWKDENDPTERSDEAADGDGADDEVKSIESTSFTGFRAYSDVDVIMRTTAGEMRFAMRPDAAPNTAWNFLHLCENGFYRDVTFHRIVPLDRFGRPFVIQAGDPSATGDGGAGWWLPIERSTLPHDFGVISMARADDPDSAGSQFFICLGREGTARLDGQYCAFGYAVEGGPVIKTISETPLADVAAGRPEEPPVILACELVHAPPRTPGEGRPDEIVKPTDKPEEFLPPGRIDR